MTSFKQLKMKEESVIIVENLTKSFGDFTAVDNVSLDIYKGELFCLLGGSGCGKSKFPRITPLEIAPCR